MSTARPIPQSYYYSGQGRLGIGDRDPTTGIFSNVIFVGNVKSLTLDIAVTKFEHKEQMSGNRAIDETIIQAKTPTFKFSSESLILPLLTQGLYGTLAATQSGTVVDEPHSIKLGAAIPLKFPNVSNVVLKKGSTTIVETGNYDKDLGFGTIYPYLVPALTTLVDGDTVLVSYSYGAHDRIEAFTTGTPPERYLRFEGLNTINGDLRLIEIPRAAFDPITGLEMINDELGSGDFGGNMLPDLTVTDATKSQYFRDIRVKAPV